MTGSLEEHLTAEQLSLWAGLTSPAKIQGFLDEIAYSAEDTNRSPLQVIQDRKAHCYDGALFAVAALRRLGHAPIVVDILPEPGRDDDHLLAIFKRNGFLGAIAKSNFVGLRYREPIHRNVRELVLSYFEDYFNVLGEKTLRGYAGPVNLSTFDRLAWEWCNEGVDAIVRRLETIRRTSLLTPAMAAELLPVDSRSLGGGLYGSDPDGLFRPPEG